MATMLDHKRAPMASAPMKYHENGEVAWGEMWDSFCVLALDGGPPHRGELLSSQAHPDVNQANYQFATQEIIRGVREVSGLQATHTRPGWIAVECASIPMADWLAQAVQAENVEAHSEGRHLLLPVGDAYTLKGEIKNVITAVAKTTHYWGEHIPTEVKQTLLLQANLVALQKRLTGWAKKLFRL